MKTHFIPAQITTVEDRITATLTLTQIFLLMIPVFWATLIFIVIPPKMQANGIKIGIILLISSIFLVLSFRIKEKIVLHWLIILFRYIYRPKLYIPNKNDNYLRETYFHEIEKKHSAILKKSNKIFPKHSFNPILFSYNLPLEQLITDPRYHLSLKTNRKGVLHVAIEQIITKSK